MDTKLCRKKDPCSTRSNGNCDSDDSTGATNGWKNVTADKAKFKPKNAYKLPPLKQRKMDVEVFSTSKTYAKDDFVGKVVDSFSTAFKCVKTACAKGSEPTKANGWKELKLLANIVSAGTGSLTPKECYPFQEEFQYKAGDKVTIGGYVFKCLESAQKECPYVNPKDPENGRDVWEATGERGKLKAIPEQKEVDAIPMEFVMANSSKFSLRKGDKVQFGNTVYECLLDYDACTKALKTAADKIKL